MAVLGQNGKPAFSYFAYSGGGNPNNVVEKLTAPSRIKLVTLGAWLGGWNASCNAVLGVWDAVTGNLLGQTAEFNVANEGAAAVGHVSQYEVNLTTPVFIDDGADFFVGAAKFRPGAMQWSTGSNSYKRSEATTSYPTGGVPLGDLGDIVAAVELTRRIGAYVADYELGVAAHVRRSSAWVTAGHVYVMRSGVWVDATALQVDRSGVWVDAT